MRPLTTAVFATVAAFLLLPASLAAQEEMPEAQKRENATYYEVVQVDYKPGKQDTALALWKKYVNPAVRKADLPGPAMALVHQTGSWDLTLIWELQRGPSAFEWETTPEGAMYQKHLIKQAGGQKKLQKIGETYDSFVARQNVTLTYQPADMIVEKEQENQ